MNEQPRTLSTPTSGDDFERLVRHHFDRPVASVKVEAGTEAADTRAFTLQVVDRRGKDWPGRWFVAWFITPTEGGDADATDNTVGALTAGTAWQTVTADAAYVSLSDANGLVAFDLTVVGAGTRYLYAAVVGRMDAGDPFDWA